MKLCNLHNIRPDKKDRKFWLLSSVNNRRVKRLKKKLKALKYTQGSIEKDIRKYHVDLEEDFEQIPKICSENTEK